MDQNSITVRVAEVVLDRRHRRDPDHQNMLFEVQQTFEEGDELDLAALILAHLLYIKQELGEAAVREVHDRNARVPAWN